MQSCLLQVVKAYGCCVARSSMRLEYREKRVLLHGMGAPRVRQGDGQDASLAAPRYIVLF